MSAKLSIASGAAKSSTVKAIVIIQYAKRAAVSKKPATTASLLSHVKTAKKEDATIAASTMNVMAAR
jgi:hypothetical protein